MKKLSILFAAILVAISSFAEKGAMILYGPLQLQVTAVSPNGKWACGIYGDGTSIIQGMLWNLETGEQTYLSTIDESTAWDVTNDGLVVGSYTDYVVTGNGAGAVVPGYYKDGVWTRFDNSGFEGINPYGGEVSMITPDGRIAVGKVQMSSSSYKIAPARWVDGKLDCIFEYEGAGTAYAVSDDGKYTTGWAYTPDDDGDMNRTIALWDEEGNVEYIFPHGNGPSAFEAGRYFSPDGKKLLCETFGHKVIYDIETKEVTDLPWIASQVWNQVMCYLGDNNFVLGGEEWQDPSTGAGGRYGYVYDGEKAITLDQWLLDEHNVVIDADEHLMFRAVTMSDDQKVMAILDYPMENGIPYGDWSSIIIKFDEEVDYCSPVGLEAEKLRGIMKVRLTWKEPMMNAEEVQGYTIYRNGESIYTGNDGLAYIDEVAQAGTYEYAITAWYEDEAGELVESEKSTAATIEVGEDVPNHILNLESHNVNYNDLKLRWSAPESNLPSVSYYNPLADFAGFGGGNISFAVAIRVPLDMTANYAGTHQVARIAFMPCHNEATYTVKVLVNGEEKSAKAIDKATLRYNEINIIDLDTFVSFEAADDVLAVVEVDASKLTSGSNAVIAMEFGSVEDNYSDLLRQLSESEFYSLNQSAVESGMGTMPVSWVLSAIFAEVDETGVANIEADVVAGYDIYRNDSKIATVTELDYIDRGLAEGQYTYAVVTNYADGNASEAQSIDVDFECKEEALSAVKEVEVYAGTTDLLALWSAPINNDATVISYATGTASGKGITMSGATDLIEYTVATDYTYSYVDWYEGYTIEALRFYPVAEAIFSVALEVNGEDVFFRTLGEMGAVDGYTLNTWNNVKLDVPVTIEEGNYYRVKVVCTDVDPSTYPINIDNTPGVMGVSDLYSWDYMNYSSAQADGSLMGNWMIGMLVANSSTELLPVKGYNVLIDGDQANSELVTETQFKKDGFAWMDGDSHRIKVNTVYNIADTEKVVEGETVIFNVRASVESIEVDRVKVYPNPATSYVAVEGEVERLALVDMAGRTVAEAQGATIDVTAVAVGNYLLNIYNGNDVRTVKVVVVR